MIRINYAEIYNEEIRDLLSASPNEGLKIIDDPNFGPIIQNTTEGSFTTAKEVKTMLDEGEKRRHFGETNMNVRSSRSHVIVRLLIESRKVNVKPLNALRTSWGKDKPHLISTLNLVDLAGSERANKAGTSGERLKEGSYINRSLLTLGTVIATLSEIKVPFRMQHIPYRNSKLTRLLATALGGNAKTCVISCISPASGNLGETLNTLRFSQRAKRIVNHVHKNEMMDMKTLMSRLLQQSSELEQLRYQLEVCRQLGFNPDDEAGDSLRSRLISANKKWHSVQFMLMNGGQLINSLRAVGMAHLASTIIISMRQAVSGERDVFEVFQDLSSHINTYLSQQRGLLTQLAEVEMKIESETTAEAAADIVEDDNDDNDGDDECRNSAVYRGKDGDIFTLLQRGGEEIHEQLESALFGNEDLRGSAIYTQTMLQRRLEDAAARERSLQRDLQEQQKVIAEQKESIGKLKASGSNLQKQVYDIKAKWKKDNSNASEQTLKLNEQIRQMEMSDLDKENKISAASLEKNILMSTIENLRGQIDASSQEMDKLRNKKTSLEEDIYRMKNDYKSQLDKLHQAMNEIVEKGGRENKVIEQQNFELQKEIGEAKDSLDIATKEKEKLQAEVAQLTASNQHLSNELKSVALENKALKDEVSLARPLLPFLLSSMTSPPALSQ